jgi:hypothetical protein
MMKNGAELVELKKAIQSGARLTDEQVQKLAALRRESNLGRRFVRVGKLALREGEELMEFVHTICGAVMTDRIVLANGSLDAWVEGIFDAHVIVRDANTGRLFKASFERGADGAIKFGEPVEVRVAFVPVSAEPAAKSAPEPGAEAAAGEPAAAPESEQIIEIEKPESGKWGFLPTTLRGR